MIVNDKIALMSKVQIVSITKLREVQKTFSSQSVPHASSSKYWASKLTCWSHATDKMTVAKNRAQSLNPTQRED